jgi:hypothetical protein
MVYERGRIAACADDTGNVCCCYVVLGDGKFES